VRVTAVLVSYAAMLAISNGTPINKQVRMPTGCVETEYKRTTCGTWPAVRAECQALGGDLVTVHSAAKNNEMIAFMNSFAAGWSCGGASSYAWIGAYCSVADASCQWVDGFTTRGCNDDSTFIDALNFTCPDWVGFDCSSFAGYTQAELDEVMANCKDSCDLCETDARAGFAWSSGFNAITASHLMYDTQTSQWETQDGATVSAYGICEVPKRYRRTACGTWPTVRAECQAMGGDLAVVPSAAKNTEILAFKQSFADWGTGCENVSAWIGAYDCDATDGCQWVNGSAWTAGVLDASLWGDSRAPSAYNVAGICEIPISAACQFGCHERTSAPATEYLEDSGVLDEARCGSSLATSYNWKCERNDAQITWGKNPLLDDVCWVRMPSGCDGNVSAFTSAPTEWFFVNVSIVADCINWAPGHFNSLCSKTDAETRLGQHPYLDGGGGDQAFWIRMPTGCSSDLSTRTSSPTSWFHLSSTSLEGLDKLDAFNSHCDRTDAQIRQGKHPYFADACWVRALLLCVPFINLSL